ncbi:hypothetical protein QNH39_08280 [Neobacillus novalis]|uniref:Uncharacterized protein n=1 Tax=Neobacillus novalis TaxID=220687 RepID=A0AA95MX28_9BACI|nr:hypothetical protein [Neobacillus novalis]WHY87813.1 hypothetical protein QNH39_08280 [Neobacillus novalis]
MEFMRDDPGTYYKELEAEINKRIHAPTNCRSFIVALGRALEVHLKQVRIHRSVTTRWLKRLDLPNKDDIAAISVRIVDCEEKLDLLDDTIYTINQRQQENQQQIRVLRESSEELLAVLANEVRREIKGAKIKSLVKDLWELKQLFYEESKDGGDLQ